MKILKRFFGSLIIIMIALIVIAFVLPRHVSVERSVVINAPPDVVFPLVNNQSNSEKWSPWLA